MKIVAIALMLWIVGFPKPSSCEYVIQLASGGSFTVNAYREDAECMLFYANGGRVGISKKLIRHIYRCSPGIAPPEKSAAITIPNPTPSVATEKKAPLANNEKDTEIKKESRELQTKTSLEEALEQFRLASRNKDETAKKSAIKAVAEISGRLAGPK